MPFGKIPFLAYFPYFEAAFISAIRFSFGVIIGTVQPGLRVKPLGLSAVFNIQFFTHESISEKLPYLSILTGSTFPEIPILSPKVSTKKWNSFSCGKRNRDTIYFFSLSVQG